LKEVKVNIKDNSYKILIGKGIIKNLGSLIGEYPKSVQACIISDENVSNLYLGKLEKSISGFVDNSHVVIIPSGEEHKNLYTIKKIYDSITAKGLSRDSLIFSLGGGVVGDIAGFVASTYMRGIDYIQIPTTLLAQVDSSVGGKTGVNHKLGKNLIGTFYQPKGVFIDPDLLKTLQEREIKSGLVEIVKHSIIRNRKLFEYIENNLNSIFDLNPEVLEKIIEENCKIKAEIVTIDEKEKGLRVILNFGHTIGHALETIDKYKTIRHGEAVGFGIIAASFIGKKLEQISNSDYQKICNLIFKIVPSEILPDITPQQVINAMELDKKKQKGNLRFVLSRNIGSSIVKSNIPLELIKESILEIRRFKGKF